MNKELIIRAFNEWQMRANADYAVTSTDKYGDCMSCVNDRLANDFGHDSKGIWLKHWTEGMNAEAPIGDLNKVVVAHDITEEQARTFYEVFGQYFHVFPEQYDSSKCFVLYDNTINVYRVEQPYTYKTGSFKEEFWNKDEAVETFMDIVDELDEDDRPPILTVCKTAVKPLKTYRVRVSTVVEATIIVEAKNEDEACDMVNDDMYVNEYGDSVTFETQYEIGDVSSGYIEVEDVEEE